MKQFKTANCLYPIYAATRYEFEDAVYTVIDVSAGFIKNATFDKISLLEVSGTCSFVTNDAVEKCYQSL